MISQFRRVLAVLVVAVSIGVGVPTLNASPALAAEQPFFALMRSKTSASYSLATIDPATAATTSVKQLDFSKVGGRQYGDLRAAGYNTATGLFYAFDTTYQELYHIEPQYGVVKHLGTFSPSVTGGITAMAIDSAGNALAMGANNLLYNVSLSSAALSKPEPVGGLASSTKGIESMSFVGTTLYAYAERTATSSAASPVLGVSIKIEKSNSKWVLADYHYDSSKATGTMDAYGIVVQDNTYMINQLVGGENRLMTAVATSPKQGVTFSSRGVMASGTGQIVRGFYTVSPIALTFDSNGGSPVATVYAANGGRISKPTSPTRPAASFEGWFTQPAGGTRISWPYTLTTSTIVYAQWNATPATLSFDSHGGSAVEPVNAFVGDEIAEPTDPTRTNYGFDGWYTASTGGSQVSWPYSLNSDTTLHAVWTQQSASLTLNKQNGGSVDVINSFAGVEIDEPTIPIRDGATFKGWFDQPTGGNKITWPLTLSADTTLWAQWEVTIQFVSQGGTPVEPVVADLGASVSAPAAPTFTHRTFVAWFDAATGGNQISWPLTLNAHTFVYAHWNRVAATVAFDSHGGTSVDPVSTFRGELLSEPIEPTKTNAAFEGWFDQPSGGNKVVWSLFVTADTTLHAQWNTVPVTLSFDSQGGTPVASINTYAGEELPMPSSPSRAGYSFAGWFESTSSDQEVLWPYEVTSNATLYARWTQEPGELAATGAPSGGIFGVLGLTMLGGGGVLAIVAKRRQRYFSTVA